jgi:hypothetical protein
MLHHQVIRYAQKDIKLANLLPFLEKTTEPEKPKALKEAVRFLEITLKAVIQAKIL